MGRAFVSIHAEEVARALASGQATRSSLVASWQRSARLHRLDPAGNPAVDRLPAMRLREAREAMAPLIASAQPSLDRLFLAVGGVGCSVLLADRHGVPVDRRGAVADDETFEAWGLWTGTDWSEAAQGANGIGTSIVEQRALTIHRDQHFLARNALLSCTTAPIFDEHGELAAALDVSSCRADLTEGFVHLIAVAVADAARRIEAENFRLAFAKARIVMAPCARKGRRGADRRRRRRPRRRGDARRASGAESERPRAREAATGERPDRRRRFGRRGLRRRRTRGSAPRARARRRQCLGGRAQPRRVARHAPPQDESARTRPRRLIEADCVAELRHLRGARCADPLPRRPVFAQGSPSSAAPAGAHQGSEA